MTASDEAVTMATVAAQAASDKLADDVVVIDVSGATGHHRLLRDRIGDQRASGQRHRRRGRREDALGRLQAGTARRCPRRPLDTAGLRRHRRAHPASGRAQFLFAGPVMARLPHHSGRPGAGGACAVRIRRLVMLRHGQTEFNAGNRMQGQLDTELSDLGRDQAVAAAEVLAKRQPLLIVSSDLRSRVRHRGGARRAVRPADRSGYPAARDAPRGLAGHDASRG